MQENRDHSASFQRDSQGDNKFNWLMRLSRILSRYPQLFIELVLAGIVIHAFQFESRQFSLAAIIFLIGGFCSWALPGQARIFIMILTGVIGTFWLLDFLTAAAVIGICAAFITIVGSSLRIRIKCLLLLIFGTCLLVSRNYLVEGPVVTKVVSLIGAVFMIRLICYLKDISVDPKLRQWPETVAYFFLLPNLAMPLFPAVDFKTFFQSRLSSEETNTFQKGLDWVCNGIIQLSLHRLLALPVSVYSNSAITSYGEMAQFMLANYLLYLRISGTFHIAIGMICLFGFDLPRTNRNYLLATNFMDYWNRANIYWKDFMLKVFYYPSFFLLRRFGRAKGMIAATIVVFMATWALHGYQLFWLNETFPLQSKDFIFWGVICLCVIVNTLWADQQTPNRNLGKSAGSFRTFFIHTAKITFMLVFITFLWSIWTTKDPLDFFANLFLLKWKGIADFSWLFIFPTIGVVGAILHRLGHEQFLDKKFTQCTFRMRDFVNTSILLLLIISSKFVEAPATGPIKKYWQALHDSDYFEKLTRRFAERDYYESTKRVREKELPKTSFMIAEWETEAAVLVPDFRTYVNRPNTEFEFRGNRLKTNQWGMVDKEYPLEKESNTLRIALLGASISSPYGIAQGKEWPKVAENMLNSSRGLLSGQKFTKIELINFSIIGNSCLTWPYYLEKNILQFKPDILLVEAVSYTHNVMGSGISRVLRDGLTIPYPEVYELLGLKGPADFLATHYFTWTPIEEQRKVINWSFQKLNQLADSIGSRKVLVLLPFPKYADPKADAEWLQVGTNAGFEVLDLSQTLNGFSKEEVLLDSSDWNSDIAARTISQKKVDMHFNAVGHEKTGIEFAAEFEKYLSKFPFTSTTPQEIQRRRPSHDHN
jgi:hypothetical protein